MNWPSILAVLASLLMVGAAFWLWARSVRVDAKSRDEFLRRLRESETTLRELRDRDVQELRKALREAPRDVQGMRDLHERTKEPWPPSS